MKTWTMAQAKSDFERGLFKGVSIYFYELVGNSHYVVSLDSTLNLDGSGALVDARTGHVREFKTMDSAHSAIRQIGFRSDRFCVSSK